MRPLWYSFRDTMRASCSKWDSGGYSTGWEKRSNSISRHGQSLLGFDTVRRCWQCIQRKCDKSRWTTEMNCNTYTLLYLLHYIFSKYPLEYLHSDITVMVGWALKKQLSTCLSLKYQTPTITHIHSSHHISTIAHICWSQHTSTITHIQWSHHTPPITHLHWSHHTPPLKSPHTSTEVTRPLKSPHTSTEVTTHLQSHIHWSDHTPTITHIHWSHHTPTITHIH